MPRCLVAASAFAALAVPVLAGAQALSQSLPQLPRNFPTNALRGEMVVTAPPEVLLNGKAAQLAPGARIRGTNNMLVMSGALAGQKVVVNYTLEQYGLLHDVWVLRPEEIAKTWPKTAQEAAQWAFDPLSQSWTKR